MRQRAQLGLCENFQAVSKTRSKTPCAFAERLLSNSGIFRDLFLRWDPFSALHVFSGVSRDAESHQSTNFQSHALAAGAWLVAGAVVLGIVVMVKRVGIWGALRRLFVTGFGGQFGGQQRNRGPARENFDKVSRTIQKLPTVQYVALDDFENLSIHSLMSRLTQIGVDVKGFTEKKELVDALKESQYSSSSSCSICCEDYKCGDDLRILPCNHSFHLECIDRWFLSSANNPKPLTCPYCNSDIDKKM